MRDAVSSHLGRPLVLFLPLWDVDEETTAPTTRVPTAPRPGPAVPRGGATLSMRATSVTQGTEAPPPL